MTLQRMGRRKSGYYGSRTHFKEGGVLNSAECCQRLCELKTTQSIPLDIVVKLILKELFCCSCWVGSHTSSEAPYQVTFTWGKNEWFLQCPDRLYTVMSEDTDLSPDYH